MSNNFIDGFSALNQDEKLREISKYSGNPKAFIRDLKQLRYPDPVIQELMNGFSENTLSNFPLPFGIAPNFLINGKTYVVPMVIEESSVVAAASAAAKFWYGAGGFKAEVTGLTKSGQVYFEWEGSEDALTGIFTLLKDFLLDNLKILTERMESRGGGILDIRLDRTGDYAENTFLLDFSFNTADSMGANFINSVLEEASRLTKQFLGLKYPELQKSFQPLMCILSNYTPGCKVKTELTAPVDYINRTYPGQDLARRMVKAVRIATTDVRRAVTHNKGIFNGIDAVLLATGNDYRAVEAGAHAFASHKGRYESLSYASIENDRFVFGMEIPLSLGTVGGLTGLHPLAKWSLDLLGKPSAEELMMVVASAGLANNFSAVRSLVTTGIQKGHMKLHLENILNYLGADQAQKNLAHKHFLDKTVSYAEVEKFLKQKL